MRKARFLGKLLLAAGLTLFAAPAWAADTASDGSPVLADPSLNNAHIFPPAAATAGVAAVSAAADGPLQDCSRRNPCAMPTPARDQVRVGGPATRLARRHRGGKDAALAGARPAAAALRS